MSFSQTGSVITQSASPADFSTLNGMTGVTYAVSGRVTIINLGTNRIDFNATVNHNPEELVLICNAAATTTAANIPFRLNANTVYNYGVERVVGGATTYSKGAGIILTSPGTNSFSSKSMQAEHLSVFNWNGGDILVAGVVEFANGSEITQNSGRFLQLNATNACQLRLQSFNAANKLKQNVNNLELDGVDQPMPLFTTQGTNTGVFKLSNSFLQNPNFSYTNSVDFIDLDNSNNRSPYDFGFGTSDPTFINAITTFQNLAKRMTAIENVPGNSNGYNEIRRQVSVNVRDDTGGAITEFSYYGVDTDNGARRAGVNSIADHTTNIEYTANNASELSANLLIEAIDCNELATPIINVDDRTNASGTIPISILAFGKEVVTVNPEAYGLGPQLIVATALPDFGVTAATKAEVLAYTQADTPAKAYDLSHVFRLDNFQLYRPKIATLTANGLLNLSGHNVVIDATAEEVFSFDGSTVTIKADAFSVDNLTNAGTVTYANGATGSLMSFSGVNTWAIYSTEADRDANTNVLSSGTGAETYNFAYVSNTTYWLRIVISGETLLKSVTPAGAGTTEVDFNTSSLLSAINESVIRIDTQLGYVSPIVYFDGNEATNGNGSSARPFNNIDDAVAEAQTINANEIDVRSSATLNANAQNVNIKAIQESLLININGQDITSSLFSGLVVYGNCVTTGSQIKDSIVGLPGIGGLSNFDGIIRNSILRNTLTTAGNVALSTVGTEQNDLIEISVGSGNLSGGELTANFNLTNVGAGQIVDLSFFSGSVIIDASCTGGTIIIKGQCKITDNSSGATVNDLTFNSEISVMRNDIVSEIDANEVKIDSILQDTNELQVNQGNWLTAAGFSTHTAADVADLIVIPDNTGSVDEAAIASAVRSELTAELARIDANISTRSTFNVSDETVTVTGTLGTLDALNTSQNVQHANTQGLVSGITSTNPAEVYTYFTELSREDAFKADVSTLSTFNPAVDTVARVTLVDSCTANADMRGTDGANTVAPDNANIALNAGWLVDLMKYHNNKTVFMAADGLTPATQALAYQAVTYDNDGITPLKTVRFIDTNGNPTTLQLSVGFELI